MDPVSEAPCKESPSGGPLASESETPAAYASKYNVARLVSGAISFLGWGAVIIAAFLALKLTGGYLEAPSLPNLAPILVSLYVLFMGVLVVAAGQLMRSMIDTADHTGEILFLLKR